VVAGGYGVIELSALAPTRYREVLLTRPKHSSKPKAKSTKPELCSCPLILVLCVPV